MIIIFVQSVFAPAEALQVAFPQLGLIQINKVYHEICDDFTLFSVFRKARKLIRHTFKVYPFQITSI